MENPNANAAEDPARASNPAGDGVPSAHWRSLEELAGDPQFREMLHREFPSLLPSLGLGGDVSRRRFLQLMGASMALAGLSACARQPLERIVPYVKQPEEIIPGKPLFFASAIPHAGYGMGVLVESHQGRPTKIEGNTEHPASLGATNLFTQAAVLGLYDPERSQTIVNLGEIRSWEAFSQMLEGVLDAQQGLKGSGLRILTETVTSPTFAEQMQTLRKRFPQMKWHQYDPAGREPTRRGLQRAFGEFLSARHAFDKARVVVGLEADFLCDGPTGVRYARDFSTTRRLRDGQADISRLYVAESTPTNTGSVADHRLRMSPAEVGQFAVALAAHVGVPGVAPAPAAGGEVGQMAEIVARDLRAHRGGSIVIAGDEAPEALHVLAHAMNVALGNVGNTVFFTEPVEAEPCDQIESLAELVADLNAGKVELLLVLGGNPVYTAPADMDFAGAMQKCKLCVHLALYEDETSAYCHWHLPQAHPLESWTDLRAFDGTVTIAQPLIEPLYEGRTSHQLLSLMMGKPDTHDYDLLRERWRKEKLGGTGDFELAWRRAVHDGVIAGSALTPRAATLDDTAVRTAAQSLTRDAADASGLALVFRLDPTVLDGRFANNGWLQECPKPLTKLTWDNAALLSPQTARKLGVANEDLVRVICAGRDVTAPVWILPGQADDTITLHLGYGRTRSGSLGTGCGFDANRLRTSAAPWVAHAATVSAVGGRSKLATTQTHHSMEGRELVRSATLEHYRSEPDFAQHVEHGPGDISINPPYHYEGYAWGVAIDLTACTGCNACVIACQAENNVPIVGKEQVLNGREMQWLRIDRYFEGELDAPETHHQPIMCMQCEQAPCEVVCPVAATSHSAEGLNDMVYNRCVGTRYCSNNCPYKVRRFNFFDYQDRTDPTMAMLHNPDVTVRMRGVMEKCTYCVQRINETKIEAQKQGRQVRDGEIVTACQQACPSAAIVFGDINDKQSLVSHWKAQPTNYGILTELGTRPRTTFLAKVRNPNPEMERS